MAKKKYILYTQELITRTWKYEWEADEADVDLKGNTETLEIGIELLEYVRNNGIEGRCLDDDDADERFYDYLIAGSE